MFCLIQNEADKSKAEEKENIEPEGVELNMYSFYLY